MTEITPENDLKAYYYQFNATYVRDIDIILSAIARAGKAFHSTADWNYDCESHREYLKGKTPIEWIQSAANDAADTITALQAKRDALKARVAELNEARLNAINEVTHSEITNAIECGYQKLDELDYKDIASNITNLISFKLFSGQELLGQILATELKRREAGEWQPIETAPKDGTEIEAK